MNFNYILFLMVLASLYSCTERAQVHTAHDEQDAHGGHVGMGDMLMLSKDEMIKANIQTDTVRMKSISEEIRLTGAASVNENEVTVISSQLRGRLERLHARNAGEFISNGMPLYDIYSEELLADENDYLLALDQYRNAVLQKETAKQLAEASRKKLLAWAMSEEQIMSLEKSNSASPVLSVFSNMSGYIIELSVREGEYVEVGTPIVKIAELGTIWIEAQVYSDELQFLKDGPKVSVEFEIYPGKLMEGEIVFDNPAFELNRKVNLVRVKVGNMGNKYRPGMMAYINLKRKERKALVVPKSALLIERMVSVWVQTSEGMFEPRMVATGIENKTEVEILSGLTEGDIVVTSGAYLLKSEQTVKQGFNSMGGMEM